MEWTIETFTALLSIIIIDLVLAGDNAIVIALAARKLPKEMQSKAILWGTAGAIIVRFIATFLMVWLLNIPGLLLIGGLILLWITFKLLTDNKDHKVMAAPNAWSAIKTIIVADIVMGLDNILAIAGAAQGNYLLAAIGLIISVPIIIWGSTLILKYIERYPSIQYIGAGVLAWVATKMIVNEKLVQPLFDGMILLEYIFQIIIMFIILYFSFWTRKYVKHN